MEDKAQKLAKTILDAVEKLAEERGVSLPEGFKVLLERPKREGQGDWATNAAMKLSKVFQMSPMALAGEIVST